MHAPMPQQQPEQRHVWSKQAVGQAAADPNNHQQQEADKGEEVPRQYRLPQPPGKRTVPAWVEDCFEKDEMARVTGDTLNISFLREGLVPEVDMNLYLQLTYEHDGSHPEHYRSWARMLGKITHVYPPPEVGVYAVYEGQQPKASDADLQQLRSTLPALPPSLFGLNASCSCCRTAEQVVQKYGAVHGQRVKAQMWLTKMDLQLEPQLGGYWDIELILNDNLDSMWVLCSMEPTPEEDGDAPSNDDGQVLTGNAAPASHASRPDSHPAVPTAAPTANTQADIRDGVRPSGSAAGAGTLGQASRDQQQQQQQGGAVKPSQPQGHVQHRNGEQRLQAMQPGQQQQWQQRDVDRRGEAPEGLGERQQRDVKQQGVEADNATRWDVREQQQRDKEGREGSGQQQQQQQQQQLQQRQRGWDQQQPRGWKREQPDSAVERPFSAKRVQ